MPEQPTTESLNRSEFLRSLGVSSAALMAIYCMGTLTSCSGSKSDPTPATTTPTPTPGTGTITAGLTGNALIAQGKINFALDLTTSDYKGLKTEGGFVTPGDIIVANTKGGKFVALTKACTHQQTTVEYQLNVDNFYCPNHGSRYSDGGAVLNGPAAASLKSYTAKLSADGNTLTISE